MCVFIETILSQLDIPRERIVETVHRMLQDEDRGHAAITIVFVDDAYIRRLNHEYRHLNRATDVLSFSMDEGKEPETDVLGDVYVSMDRAREQAVRYHVPLDDELQRLVVHGCLHLLGYDHHRAADRRVMRRKEAGYLSDSDTGST